MHCRHDTTWANETLLLAARFGARQAGAALTHGARPAAFYWMRCSRAQRYDDRTDFASEESDRRVSYYLAVLYPIYAP